MLKDEAIEQLAKHVHLQYQTTWNALEEDNQEAPTDSKSAGRSWEDLSESLRDDNRAQARNLEFKLLEVGFALCDRQADGAIELTKADIEPFVEQLAKQEHARWMRKKLSEGWRPGKRDDARKIHDLLIPYEQLTPAQQALDEAPVRAIPDLVAAAQLAVTRTEIK